MTDWQQLCVRYSDDDGLPARPAGEWTANKLYFWHQYIGITTKAMVGNPRWDAVCYVDMFAGPGVCRLRDSGARIPGSPLIAAHSPRPFTKILLAEKDDKTAEACIERMDQTPAASSYRMFKGDCNQRVGEIAASIPDRALTVAVIDPPGFDIDFESVGTLSDRGRVDLLVLFADRMDVGRNLDKYMEPGSKLDRFLGPDSGWQERLRNSLNTSRFLDALQSIYEDQLGHLGYREFGYKTIEGRRGPLYKLVYASKHERGLDFWHKITAKDRAGQRELF